MTEYATAPGTELSDEDVRAKVLAIIKEMAPNEDVEPSPGMVLVEDLGYHSLALMEMAFTLEDEFDLDPIDEQTARKITTVGAVQDLVSTMLAERTA